MWARRSQAAPSPLRQEDRDVMATLCGARVLPCCYYEGALTLWMRVKTDYVTDLERGGEAELKSLLLVALGLCVKWMGPKDVTHASMASGKARGDGVVWGRGELLERELRMCAGLDWDFFHDVLDPDPAVGGRGTPASAFSA